jgi:hypothetical protein
MRGVPGHTGQVLVSGELVDQGLGLGCVQGLRSHWLQSYVMFVVEINVHTISVMSING